MTTVKLQDVYQQVKTLMTEYGIGDNTLFVEASVKQYNHRKLQMDNSVDTELAVSMWVDEYSNIKRVTGTNVEGILMQLRGILIEWKASKTPVEEIDPVVEL